MFLTCTPLPSASRAWRAGGEWCGDEREGQGGAEGCLCVDGVEQDYGVVGR